MAWTKVDQAAVGFHADATSHPYTFPAGAPTAGDWDVIFVNSNTTLAGTPSGWTRSLDLIANFGANNQGAYALVRKALGSEGDSVTITMSGNNNTCLSWSRWRGGNTLDVATAAVADANQQSITPSVSTGTLAGTGELVLACAALQGSFPTVTPSWSSGYTSLAGVQYNAGTVDEVSNYTAYRTDAGTAAETPQADWTSDPAAPISDRYIMVVTFTQSPGATITLGRASESDTARTLTLGKTAGISRASETDTGRPLTVTKTAAFGTASESDTAGPLAIAKTLTLGRAVSTETARPLTVVKTVALGRATESGTAGQLIPAKAAALGQAAETGLARPLTFTKTVTLGRAGETDTARPLATGLAVPLGRAVESDTARPLTVSKTLPLGRAVEADTARSLLLSRVLALGRATETTTARSLALAKTITIGRASESDTALTLTVTGGAQGADIALAVGKPYTGWAVSAPYT